jgi:hypothetical protein
MRAAKLCNNWFSCNKGIIRGKKRVLSVALTLEKWKVQGTVSQHLEIVTRYFERIRLDGKGLGSVTLRYE